MPNAARWDGETALMIAANAGSVEVVKQLIAHGADVNAAESRKGQTALMWAAAEGHPDVVQVLIENKADVNAASKSGFTRAGLRGGQERSEIGAEAAGRRRGRELRAARRHQGAAGGGVAQERPGCRARWWMAARIRTSRIKAEILRCTRPRSRAMWSW